MMRGSMSLNLHYNAVSNDIHVEEGVKRGDTYTTRTIAILRPLDEHYSTAFQALALLGSKSDFSKKARQRVDNQGSTI